MARERGESSGALQSPRDASAARVASLASNASAYAASPEALAVMGNSENDRLREGGSAVRRSFSWGKKRGASDRGVQPAPAPYVDGLFD